MILYNESGKKQNINLQNKKPIKNGTIGLTSTIYHYKDCCIKLIKNPSNYITPDTILKVKSISSNNLYKIYDIFYDSKTKKNLAAYTTKYYESYDDILDNLSMEYITDNFKDLLNLAELLATNGLEINDLHTNNIIFQKNRIVVIDTDNYRLYNNTYPDIINYIKYTNISSLRILLFNTFKLYLYYITHDEKDFNNYYPSITPILDNTTYTIDNILYNLTNYKTPLEYIKRNTY